MTDTFAPYRTIIIREFLAAVNDPNGECTVEFLSDDEELQVTYRGDVFRALCGIDDPNLVFDCEATGQIVRFDLPSDWPTE
jgi:hypothetical protein